MKIARYAAIGTALVTLTVGAIAFSHASGLVNRIPVVFYAGHSHDDAGRTYGAPQHSGGLDRRGCHNASVPYHCHR